jgi:hypothetical protein
MGRVAQGVHRMTDPPLFTSVIIEDYTCPACGSRPLAAIGPMIVENKTLTALGIIIWVCPSSMCRWIRAATDRAKCN